MKTLILLLITVNVFSQKYLHIGHPKTHVDPIMANGVKDINYSQFDILMLGGDLSNSTSLKESTIQSVDSVFELSNANTLWALGNHDYRNLDLVKKYTNRDPYYACYKNGITFIILDTQDSLSSILGEQLNMFNNVMDTIQESEYIIILMHKLIWMSGGDDDIYECNKITNGGCGNYFWAIQKNNFYKDIYPKLVNATQKVIVIGGDIGYKVDEYESLSPDNITFLASGMNFYNQNNKVLVFDHSNELTWSFKYIYELGITTSTPDIKPKKLKEVRMYDLLGRKIKEPLLNGLYIKHFVYNNNSIEARKVYINLQH